MALKDIFLALEREAAERNAETLARARREAKEIINEARERAKEIRETEIKQARAELHTQAAKLMVEAKFGAKKRLVETKEKIIDQVFKAAADELTALKKSPDYRRLFRNLLQEAAAAIGGEGSVEVRVSKNDLESARSILADKGRDVTFKPSLNNSGGVVLVFDGGRRVLTNTFDERLAKAKKALKPTVGAMLFDA